MKLAVVRQKYTPFGGAERFVERALAALRENGADVTIVARQWGGDAGGLACDPFYLGRTWRDAGFARCVQGIVASGRFDLVQSHERIPGCHIYRAGDGVHATWLALSKKPLTWLSPWHRYTLAAERAMFRDPALRAVICNARMVMDDIAARFAVVPEKLHLIRNGVDTEAFHPGLRALHRESLREKNGVGRETKVALFVGSGFDRKGAATLIEALARMQTPAVEAWIVGRDKHPARYAQLAHRLGVAERVRFFGPQTDVRPFYGAADIFCLPTLYDPFPNAALEALACGLPLITTTTCGAAELVRAGENGAVCPPRDPAALADRLDALLTDGPTLAQRQAARASAEPLTLAATASTLLDLYAALAGRAIASK